MRVEDKSISDVLGCRESFDLERTEDMALESNLE